MTQPSDPMTETPKVDLLAACPFCGGTDIITWDPFSDTGDEQLVAHCNGCLADGPNANGCNDNTDEAEAVAAWNQRADLRATQATAPPSMEEVKAILMDISLDAGQKTHSLRDYLGLNGSQP